MASNKQTAEQVKNVLGVGYFEKPRAVQDFDPIEPVSMKVPISQVQIYEGNPRQSKNPEYENLTELLRANGQEEALTITRRPGQENYIIRRGGNTRLSIMKMFHDIGDVRFEIIDCLFMPWTSESDCIVGHLNENTSQGRMTLIDKARGYRHFKLEYEKEHEVEALGQRKLSELLKKKGSPVNRTLLGTMNYALDVLELAIPETLARGLGKSQVEKLKRIDQTFQRLAAAHNLYDPETRDAQVQAEFHQLLSDHDGDEWDMELVLHEFSQRLGRLLMDYQVPYNRLKFDIDRCLERDPWKVELLSTLQDDPPQEEPPSTLALVQDDQKVEKPQNVSLSPSSVTHIESLPVEPNADPIPPEKSFEPDPVLTESSSSIEQRLTIPETSLTAGQVDLKSMRARIYTLALQFAQSTRIHHCLVHWDYGYGYFLDLPKSKLCNVMSTDQSYLEHFDHKVVTNRFSKERDDAERTFAWWLLWQAQGILEFSNDPVPGYQLMPDSMMKNLINQLYDPENKRMYTMMLSAIGKITLQAGGPTNVVDMAMAFAYIKPANMMKYIALLEARTQLLAFVEEHNTNLWMEN